MPYLLSGPSDGGNPDHCLHAFGMEPELILEGTLEAPVFVRSPTLMVMCLLRFGMRIVCSAIFGCLLGSRRREDGPLCFGFVSTSAVVMVSIS